MLKDNHALLPAFVQDVVALIGFDKTTKLVIALGGSSFHFGKMIKDTPYSRLLIDAIGEQAAEKICAVYGGRREYIPRCHLALLMIRNEAFVDEFNKLIAEGNSKNHTMTILCPKYKISDRTGWQLIKAVVPARQKPLI
ncbi:MAG: mor transcription activator family protein [Gammaproteobacteria bacterium]|nr:mor transcription activator family protein [Gammaproteobacteria bacterium]